MNPDGLPFGLQDRLNEALDYDAKIFPSRGMWCGTFTLRLPKQNPIVRTVELGRQSLLSKEQAGLALRAAVVEYVRNRHWPWSKESFHRCYESYLNVRSPLWAPSVRQIYSGLGYTHLSHFSLRDVSTFTTQELQKFIAAKEKANSHSLAQKLKILLVGTFEVAIDRDLISTNPAKKIKLGKRPAQRSDR